MKEWTVAELVLHLMQLPGTAKVTLEDADTNWIIPKFAVKTLNDDEIRFMPCDYMDMTK